VFLKKKQIRIMPKRFSNMLEKLHRFEIIAAAWVSQCGPERKCKSSMEIPRIFDTGLVPQRQGVKTSVPLSSFGTFH
jgi:hypothetical protein